MKILALEFSSPRRSAAVLDASLVETPRVLGAAAETGARTMQALKLVSQALDQGGIGREQIGTIAVGLGPGSYTGIRAAIALAQGWQLARAVNLVGISTVECLAAQAQADGLTGRVNVIVDAQRNEFYLAAYELAGPSPRVIEPLRLATLVEVRARIAAGECVAGPEVAQWFPPGRLLFPAAAVVARLAVGRTDFVPGEKLQPLYLRQTSFVKAARPRVFSD